MRGLMKNRDCSAFPATFATFEFSREFMAFDPMSGRIFKVSRRRIMKEVSAISARPWRNEAPTLSTECFRIEPKT
jgi:hypothetical protein